MIGFLLRLIRGFLYRQSIALTQWALGILISAAIRFVLLFNQWAIISTGWLLALIDMRSNGAVSRRVLSTYLSAGGLWAFIGFIAPLAFDLLIGDGQPSISMRLVAIGFVYGLYCAWRVRRLPGWGMWAADDGLPLGESARW